MKTSGMVLAVVFGFAALAITVWIGRYQPNTAKVVTPSAPAEEAPIGPPISPTGPYPKAVAPEMEFNFGTMALGSEGTHKFVLKNEGEADLEVMARKEDTTCSCTFGELSSDNKIKPGESVVVTLNWKIKTPVEVFRHQAIVRTNDPEHKMINLVVTGRVEDPLMLKPATPWSIGDVPPTGPAVVTGSVYSSVEESFEITKIEIENHLLDVEPTPMTPEELQVRGAKSGYNLKVSTRGELPVGAFSDVVSITTSLKDRIGDQGEVGFRVNGNRPGPIEVIGPGYRKEANVLLMGEFPAAEGKEVTLSILVRNLDEDLKLESAEQTFNSVELDLRKDEKFQGKTQRYHLKVKVPPGSPQDRFRKKAEKINLKFNHPDAKEMRFYVEFLSV